MSEYTPTTEEIRYRLILGADPFDLNADEREDLEEFNRWLNSVKAEAWDEGESAGGYSAGNGIASLLSGVEPPPPIENPYRTGGAE